MKYLPLLFQLMWFYVPFVYWIVNGVYFPPVCDTFFFFFSPKDTLKDESLYNAKYEILIAFPRLS